MDISWFEDFVCLVEARGFSQAAQRRGVSQPTFSRRIQALEEWLGTELIDRSAQGVRLTSDGRIFHAFSVEILHKINEMRAVLKGHGPTHAEQVRFSVAHTLSITSFPAWLKKLKETFPLLQAHVTAVNVHEAATALMDGKTDFVMVYHHPQLPVMKTSLSFPYLTLGKDRVVPCSGVKPDGSPIFKLPGSFEKPLPFMAYGSGAYLALVVERILLGAGKPCFLERTSETHMSEALKAMVVEGHGIGWLPENCARRELTSGRLAIAGDASWTTEVEIRLYRAADSDSPMVNKIWDYFSKQSTDTASRPATTGGLQKKELQ
ncbi:transcriptional regulator, LysR family [Formivibrio citricus]|uniref:Transcriptional regulator, LysR family n=1 Tax=Formivibrio citricus TaxID=83765 RepID=A0A1I4YQ08_9NEIS|nr:LysR family transcriptional regulator [Formivibrio citricus]SFN40092.1 transcriptional regulator, LysR family [Formivibrio citricus]